MKIWSGQDVKTIAKLQEQAIDYIESCHLADGGYFFARVVPSCARDTYFAIKSLHVLGVEPRTPETIIEFLLDLWCRNSPHNRNSIFLIVEALAELGYPVDEFSEWGVRILRQNESGGFGMVQKLNVEMLSELEATYQAVSVLRRLQIPFDEKKVQDFVLSFLNSDGGFGGEGRSTLATAYYATEIIKLLNHPQERFHRTVAYLRQREVGWHLSFIEDIFWLVEALHNLGEGLHFPSRVIEFVRGCQRINGGYARATAIGIPTLEYTYYAVSLLALTNAFPRHHQAEVD